MQTYNIFEFWVSNNRVSHILKAFSDAKITENNSDCSKVQLKVTDGTDLLYLFHAGIECGMAYYNTKTVAA